MMHAYVLLSLCTNNNWVYREAIVTDRNVHMKSNLSTERLPERLGVS